MVETRLKTAGGAHHLDCAITLDKTELSPGATRPSKLDSSIDIFSKDGDLELLSTLSEGEAEALERSTLTNCVYLTTAARKEQQGDTEIANDLRFRLL